MRRVAGCLGVPFEKGGGRLGLKVDGFYMSGFTISEFSVMPNAKQRQTGSATALVVFKAGDIGFQTVDVRYGFKVPYLLHDGVECDVHATGSLSIGAPRPSPSDLPQTLARLCRQAVRSAGTDACACSATQAKAERRSL